MKTDSLFLASTTIIIVSYLASVFAPVAILILGFIAFIQFQFKSGSKLATLWNQTRKMETQRARQ